ncbi:lipid-A-disaccharide synthase [Oceanicaulis sp. AH-315-P02]|nr:lipid-A-disaccharide synthase [Robiginitomaculum sp.]MBN4047751.1 lipid-A-disaccharide synthase [Oceanicaulis sp. AH-315-P02]
MDSTRKIFILAVEPSGDQLGAYLIQQLRKNSTENLNIKGIGGSKMADLGVASSVDVSALAVVGLIDGLRIYSKVKTLVNETVKKIVEHNPQVVVLIDSWGFTIRVAKQIKKLLPETLLIKYVGPQVFATRPGRAKTTATYYDHLLTIHTFDGHFFENEGLKTTFVGNPALYNHKNNFIGSTLEKYNPKNQPLIGVFLGSRENEIKQLCNVMLTAIEIVKKEYPDLVIVAPLSDNIATLVRSMAIEDKRLQNIILLDEVAKIEVFSNIDLSLACSGTVTLELADAGVPTVVAYRIGGWLGVVLQKLMFKARFASLINLSADEEIFPEFINLRCTAQNLANSLATMLQSPDQRNLIKKKLKTVVAQMRGQTGNPSEIAAKKVLSLLDQRLETGK